MAAARFHGLELPAPIFGVRVRIHISWMLMALLIAWSLAAGSLPMLYKGLPTGAYWTMAAIIVVGLALSIILHEFAHTLTGRALGMSVERITLFLFGGVAELKEEPTSARVELAMALAGPLFSVVLGAALAFAAGAALVAGAPAEITNALGYLATLNLVLAAFNMLPAFPLDGGRVLRAAIWMARKDLTGATRIAARSGELFAWLLMGAGLTMTFVADVSGGLWWVLIGMFLHGAARGALQDIEAKARFSGHRVRELMVTPVETAAAGMTLERFVEDRVFRRPHDLYPVVAGDEWVGAIAPGDVLRVPRDHWATTTVGEICTPRADAPVAAPEDDLAEALQRMQVHQARRLPVVDGRKVVGMVTLNDLLARLELERRFRPATA